METFGKICLVVVLLVLISLLQGYVFSNLWAWLIAPTFKVEPLTVMQSIGLAFFIAYVKQPKNSKEEKELPLFTKFLTSTGEAIIYAVLALGFGWIIHFYI